LNLIDRERIVVIVVDLESPQFLLLIYVIFQFRTEEMAKIFLREALLGIRRDQVQGLFVGISFRVRGTAV
jgi:hypothetical protein